MENEGFLFAAYIVAWVVLFGYVLFLFNKQKKLQDEIESLKNTLGKKDGKDA